MPDHNTRIDASHGAGTWPRPRRRSWRARGGFVTTVLVMVVLATVTVSLTVASRAVISARHEQVRRARDQSLERMLAAGAQWLAAGGAAVLPTAPGETLRLPLPDEGAASSIDKVLIWQVEPDGTYRLTARWIRPAAAGRSGSTEPWVLAEKVRRGVRLPSSSPQRPEGTPGANVLSDSEGEPE